MGTVERFYSRGCDILDAQKPGIICGVPEDEDETAAKMAAQFNSGESNPADYMWWTDGDENSPMIAWEDYDGK